MSEDPRTVFVGNLSENVTDSLLRELFVQVGPVDHVNIPSSNGKKSQFGFVVFKHECSVPYAKALLDGTLLCQRNIKVNTKGGQYVPPYVPSPLLLGFPDRRPHPNDEQILRGFNPGRKRGHDDSMKPHQPHQKRHKRNHNNFHIPDTLGGRSEFQEDYQPKHERQWKRHNDRSHKYDHNRHMHPKKFNHRHKEKKNRNNHIKFED